MESKKQARVNTCCAQRQRHDARQVQRRVLARLLVCPERGGHLRRKEAGGQAVSEECSNAEESDNTNADDAP